MPRKSNYSTQIVLDKAFELARERGIDSVTYNGLARELGMKPQSMYRYVPDLGQLRVALLSGFLNELMDKIAGATEGLAPVDALRTFAVMHYDECHANRCYYESFALMHRYEIIEDLREPLTRQAELLRKPLAQIIRDESEVNRYTQLMMAVILGYAQMAQKAFVVESLADNREAYVKSIEEFINGVAGASRCAARTGAQESPVG